MDNDHVSIMVEDELVKSMKEKVESLVSVPPGEEARRTIYRVLPATRDEDPRSYDPKIISIGPFHRNNQALQPMESFKWRYLQDLLQRSPTNTLEKYVQVARASAAAARKHYSESVEPAHPDAFAEMLVLDGCFVIEFLVKSILGDNRGHLYTVNWNLPLLRNDLLLLENQIPFFILQSLFDSSVVPGLAAMVDVGDSPYTLTELALVWVTNGRADDISTIPHDVHHLLHLFHATLRPNPDSNPDPYSGGRCAMTLINKIKNLIFYSFFWLLSIFLFCRRPPPGKVESSNSLMMASPPSDIESSKPAKNRPKAPRVIPSASKLREAGIKFQNKKTAKCFLDVSFKKGTMEIPQMCFQEATISQFRNLVAFEQCCPAAGSHFTAYAALMGNLISTPADVALLEGCGILESKLHNAEEVARFFSNLCKGGYLDYQNHYLVRIYQGVKEYSEVEFHRWRAMLIHDYFGNPWAITSLVAAGVLLILTAVATVYAVLAYVHPPK